MYGFSKRIFELSAPVAELWETVFEIIGTHDRVGLYMERLRISKHVRIHGMSLSNVDPWLLLISKYIDFFSNYKLFLV